MKLKFARQLLLSLSVISGINLKDDPPIARWFHGINDSCADDISDIQRLLPDFNVKCIETGRGQFGSFNSEIQRGCEILEQEKDLLSSGFTLIGISQGGLIARAILQACSVGAFARRLITVGAPHNGVALLPNTAPDSWVNWLIPELCYFKAARTEIGPCGYMRSLRFFREYRESGVILLDIDNELSINAQYKERVEGLDLFMNVRFENDKMVQPSNSPVFGFYADEKYDELVPMEETEIYKEDRIGLTVLNESGRLFRCSLSGGHLEMSELEKQRLIVDFANKDTRDFNQHLDYLKTICAF